MPEPRVLTTDDIEMIAERAADKALEKVYAGQWSEPWHIPARAWVGENKNSASLLIGRCKVVSWSKKLE